MSELEATARKGAEDIQPQFKVAVESYRRAEADAKAALKAAERPAYVLLKVSGHSGGGEIIVRVDDVEVARTRLTTYVLDRLMPGLRKFQVHAKTKDGKELEVINLEELKPDKQTN